MLTGPADEIAQFRTELNELLWDFDDYVEVDEFDPDKFSELQALAKKAAPRVHDILVRMKLEAPGPGALSPTTPTIVTPKLQTSHTPNDSTLGDQDSVAMGSQSGPDLGLAGTPPAGHSRTLSRSDTTYSAASSIPSEPPSEPETNPWQVGQRSPVATIPEEMQGGEPVVRRQRVSTRPDSPTLPPSPIRPLGSLAQPAKLEFLGSGVYRPEARRPPPSNPLPPAPVPKTNASSLSTTPTASSAYHTPPSGLHSPANGHPPRNNWPPPAQGGRLNTTQLQPGIQLASPSSSRYSPASSLQGSAPSSLFEGHTRESVYEAVSPATTHNRVSMMSMPGQSPTSATSQPNYTQYPQQHQHQPHPLQIPRSLPPTPNSMPPATPVELVGTTPTRNTVEVDSGLIPVHDDGTERQYPVQPPRVVDCTIGPGSSFNLLKGFCEGAKEVQRGGAGVKQTRKLVCLDSHVPVPVNALFTNIEGVP
jgi:hypothetical protein